MQLTATSSSWRECSLQETLEKIRKISSKIGITRVTNITRLDKIGVPVYASIRPTAAEGSLCVNAGKGLYDAEAKVGAYMEAFEYAMAEFNSRRFRVYKSTPRKIASQKNATFQFIDLCPVWAKEINPDEPISIVKFTDIESFKKIDIPAELAFSPFIATTKQEILFGSSTNGLCSGNSIQEATIHGIFEVIERDVQAFNFFQDTSILVDEDSFPENIQLLVRKIRQSGFHFYLRYTENIFGLPYFQAFIDENKFVPISISHGTGVHLSASIAAVRAITEAIQSRLSYIHGGRDDLIDRYNYFSKVNPDVEKAAVSELRTVISDQSSSIAFKNTPNTELNEIKPGDILAYISDKLKKVGINQILRFELNPADCELKALKIVIPKMESFNPKLKRLGPRLVAHIKRIDE